jgi:hypothetical protein
MNGKLLSFQNRINFFDISQAAYKPDFDNWS